MGDRVEQGSCRRVWKVLGGNTFSQQFPPYRAHVSQNSAPNGQVHSLNLSLLNNPRGHRVIFVAKRRTHQPCKVEHSSHPHSVP